MVTHVKKNSHVKSSNELQSKGRGQNVRVCKQGRGVVTKHMHAYKGRAFYEIQLSYGQTIDTMKAQKNEPNITLN